jgi:hypothetical protein
VGLEKVEVSQLRFTSPPHGTKRRPACLHIMSSIASSIRVPLVVRGFARKPVSGGARRGGVSVVSSTSESHRFINNRGVRQRVKAVEESGGLVESEPTWRDNTEDAQEAIIIEPRLTFGESCLWRLPRSHTERFEPPPPGVLWL